MGGSRRSLKRGKPKVRVGAPSKKKGKGVPEPLLLPGASTSLEWNIKASQTANYRKFGLASNPNLKSGRNADPLGGGVGQLVSHRKGREGEEGEEGERTDEEEGSDEEPDEVRAALGKKRKHGPSQPLQRLTKMQRVYVGNLITKHGEDVEAMSRDLKLNAMQHSPGVLKLLCRRFRTFESYLVTPSA